MKGKNSAEFYWSDSREPHFDRRKKILEAHPEVRRLFGIDRLLRLKSLMAVFGHMAIAIWFLPEHFGWMFLLALVVGATLSHVIFLAIHEITHDLAFQNKAANNWLAILINALIIFPYAMAFKYYHAEHHWQQGKEGVDTDLPTHHEAMLFMGLFGKLIWMVNQILFYALRPMIVKSLPVNRWVILNLALQALLTSLLFYYAGWQSALYLLLSLFLSGGLHPIAGHFIAEHYVFKEDQEPYSYYGPWNAITFNVGYHNEHHDFPNIPGSRLPQLREMASEYYDNLHFYASWSEVLFRFLVDEGVSLFSRVKRK